MSVCRAQKAACRAGRTRVALIAVAALVTLIAFGIIGAASALASAPIDSFTVTPSTTQAGGHPDIDTLIWVGNRDTQNIPAPSCNCQDAKDLTVHFPTGVIGDPHSTPQCTAADFGNLTCPTDSQVGTAVTGLNEEAPPAQGFGTLAVYNLIPHPGQAGLLAFTVPLVNFPVYIVINPRTESDYGLNATVTNINHVFPLSVVELGLWGVPASPSHTPLRLRKGCDPFFGSPPCYPGVPSNSPEKPFLDNPTTCGVSLTAYLNVLSYDLEATEAETTYPATTGCDQLSFNPSLFAQPTTTQTDAASGLEANLQVPQGESPSVPSPSEIRSTLVTLPPGFSINPNAADGKTSCSDAEARFGTEEEAQCPEYSKVGTVTLTSSALPGPLPGFIYIAEPKPGERYPLILTANGFDVHVKLAGVVEPNPQTGQVTVSFQNLPQTPFSDFNMHFFGSERGLLATPTQCGTYPVDSTFTPWDSLLPDQSSTQYFTLDSGPNGAPCPGTVRPFKPVMHSGVANNTAGAHTTFSINLNRSDGDQDLTSLSLTTPPGLLATLKGIPYCPDAALSSAAGPSYSGLAEEAHPSCPAASQVGTDTVGAGAGAHPVYLPGKVYLAGPYKGAPLSLAVITPAVSGPYDLGNVVVRAALHVNAETAQITAVSDPLPQILEGIPLRLRSILLELNRQDFILNPTNCDPFSVNALAGGDQGAQANLSSPFQVANCASLPFGPKLDLKLSGATKHGGNPALTATLSAAAGEANVASTSVTLPRSELIDNAHIKDPCTKVQFAANTCPAGSIIGSASADTPLLAKPLEGPVYLRSAPENKSGLPDIVAALNGQIDIDLDGKIETVGGRLRTSFRTVPDAPVSKFTLSLDGGRRGLLVNTGDLCRAPLASVVQIDGQNGLTDGQNQKLAVPCGTGSKPRRHPRRPKAVH